MTFLQALCIVCLGFSIVCSKEVEPSEVLNGLPKSIELILPVGKNGNFTLVLEKQNSNVEDIKVILGSDQNEWHHDKNEHFDVYENDKYEAVFSVSESLKNGKLSRDYLGTFVLNNKSYSVIPKIFYDENLEKYVVEKFELELGGEMHVVANTDQIDVKRTDFEVYLSPNATFLNGHPIPASDHTSVDENSSKRFKRSKNEITHLTVEVLVVADVSVYKKWLTLSKSNVDETIENIRHHFVHVIYGVDQKFKTIIDGKYSFSIKPIGIYIAKEKFKRYSGDEIDFNIHLAFFRLRQMDKNKTDLPKFDIAVAFTNQQSEEAFGIGTLKSACTTDGLALVTDISYYYTIDSTAHEIAHLLGANHDGSGNNCKVDDYYLMTPTLGYFESNNLHTFSECSKKAMEDYADKLSGTEENCMLKLTENNEHENISKYLANLPGVRFNADFQCQQLLGESSKYCINDKFVYKDLCDEMHCWDATKNICRGVITALDGTDCGNKKWCLKGKCTDIKDDVAQ